MTYEYPKIENQSIWAFMELVEKARAQPEMLKDNACPYPADFIKVISLLTTVQKVKSMTLEDLEMDIAAIVTELEDLRQVIDNADTEAISAYLKLKAALVGKLMDLKERNYNLRTMKAFETGVLKAVDQVMNPEQRTKFMSILETK